MKGRIFGFLLGIFGLLFLGVVSSYASSVPSFPTCGNPSGQVIASYPDGTHGIPGDSNSYTGADSVYNVSSNQTLQCFCGGTQGIQTNWWKVGNLSQHDISYWQSQGWVYIPDGSAWGLSATGYLAYNAAYTCSNNNPNSGGNSGGPGDGRNDGLGCGNHDCSGNHGGSSSSDTGPNTGFGGFVEGIQTGITDKVLGADTNTQTDSDSITKSICAACFWWPVLLGEIVALVGIYLLLKRGSLTGNKYLMGTIIGIAAYVAFLLVNKGHVCPDGGIGFWRFSIPCRYFWALDGIMVILFSYLTRGVKTQVVKKSSRK